jgi:hypothetical protein
LLGSTPSSVTPKRSAALRFADAVFGHDAGCFLRDGPAQVVAAR